MVFGMLVLVVMLVVLAVAMVLVVMGKQADTERDRKGDKERMLVGGVVAR